MRCSTRADDCSALLYARHYMPLLRPTWQGKLGQPGASLFSGQLGNAVQLKRWQERKFRKLAGKIKAISTDLGRLLHQGELPQALLLCPAHLLHKHIHSDGLPQRQGWHLGTASTAGRGLDGSFRCFDCPARTPRPGNH